MLGQCDRCSHKKKLCQGDTIFDTVFNSDTSGESLGGSILDASYFSTQLDPGSKYVAMQTV